MMKLMITIQLRTKIKILTKHVVKPYFYNLIFWNMKYLFFFNCQLLLLCCVCCKFAIQDFVKEDKDTCGAILTVSPTGTPTTWYL
jgi:hypothetical protein